MVSTVSTSDHANLRYSLFCGDPRQAEEVGGSSPSRVIMTNKQYIELTSQVVRAVIFGIVSVAVTVYFLGMMITR